jgi:hypothetical protein
VWAYYFLSRSRIAAVLAAVLGLIEIGFSGYRQWELLSLESLDTVAFILGAVLPVVFWTLYLLLKWRFGLWYLLLFGLSQVALSVYGISNSAALIQQFWRDEPWQLLVAPLIWVVYWVTQTLFVRAAQKA